jgi:hypothetical protein
LLCSILKVLSKLSSKAREVIIADTIPSTPTQQQTSLLLYAYPVTTHTPLYLENLTSPTGKTPFDSVNPSSSIFTTTPCNPSSSNSKGRSPSSNFKKITPGKLPALEFLNHDFCVVSSDSESGAGLEDLVEEDHLRPLRVLVKGGERGEKTYFAKV